MSPFKFDIALGRGYILIDMWLYYMDKVGYVMLLQCVFNSSKLIVTFLLPKNPDSDFFSYFNGITSVLC